MSPPCSESLSSRSRCVPPSDCHFSPFEGFRLSQVQTIPPGVTPGDLPTLVFDLSGTVLYGVSSKSGDDTRSSLI